MRFDDVRVPVENRVGEENEGWTYAKVLLSHERMMIADVPRSKRLLARLKRIAADDQSGGRPLIEEPRFRDRIAEIENRANGARIHHAALYRRGRSR